MHESRELPTFRVEVGGLQPPLHLFPYCGPFFVDDAVEVAVPGTVAHDHVLPEGAFVLEAVANSGSFAGFVH